jgi:hypothetical protein
MKSVTRCPFTVGGKEEFKMKSVPWVYKTADGKEEFHFCLEERSDGEWRVYILKQPPYGSCPQDLNSTHRQYDHKGKYIDWSYPFESLEEAKQIASLWAEYTQECINVDRFLPMEV